MLPEIPCFQNYCLYSCLLPPVSKINPKNYCLNSFTPLLPNSHKAIGFIWRATKALPAAAAGRQARHHGRPLRHGTKKPKWSKGTRPCSTSAASRSGPGCGPRTVICRGARQKRSASCGPWRGVKPARGGRSLLTFSRGNRACSLSFCCEAEMFFSSSLFLFIVIIRTLWGAKVVIFFEPTKLWAFFSQNFCHKSALLCPRGGAWHQKTQKFLCCSLDFQ